MTQRFRNREDAGRQLAAKVRAYKERVEIFVLGLARGGMVVAYEVAKELEAPLDVFLVRKLGVPVGIGPHPLSKTGKSFSLMTGLPQGPRCRPPSRPSKREAG